MEVFYSLNVLKNVHKSNLINTLKNFDYVCVLIIYNKKVLEIKSYTNLLYNITSVLNFKIFFTFP